MRYGDHLVPFVAEFKSGAQATGAREMSDWMAQVHEGGSPSYPDTPLSMHVLQVNLQVHALRGIKVQGQSLLVQEAQHLIIYGHKDGKTCKVYEVPVFSPALLTSIMSPMFMLIERVRDLHSTAVVGRELVNAAWSVSRAA